MVPYIQKLASAERSSRLDFCVINSPIKYKIVVEPFFFLLLSYPIDFLGHSVLYKLYKGVVYAGVVKLAY